MDTPLTATSGAGTRKTRLSVRIAKKVCDIIFNKVDLLTHEKDIEEDVAAGGDPFTVVKPWEIFITEEKNRTGLEKMYKDGTYALHVAADFARDDIIACILPALRAEEGILDQLAALERAVQTAKANAKNPHYLKRPEAAAAILLAIAQTKEHLGTVGPAAETPESALVPAVPSSAGAAAAPVVHSRRETEQLAAAVSMGAEDKVESIMEAGARIEDRCSKGYTAVCTAEEAAIASDICGGRRLRYEGWRGLFFANSGTIIYCLWSVCHDRRRGGRRSLEGAPHLHQFGQSAIDVIKYLREMGVRGATFVTQESDFL